MIHSALLTGSIPPRAGGDDAFLSERELGLIGPRATAKRRADFRRGRWIAKHLACQIVPGLTMQQAVILPDDFGVPHLYGPDGPLPMSLSISHSRELAAAAAVPHPAQVGIDVEQWLDDAALLAQDYFTDGERSLCSRAGTISVSMATRVWVLKEAMLKALGEGLRLSTQSVVVNGFAEGSPVGWAQAYISTRGIPEQAWTAWVREEGTGCLGIAVAVPLAMPVMAVPTPVLLRVSAR